MQPLDRRSAPGASTNSRRSTSTAPMAARRAWPTSMCSTIARTFGLPTAVFRMSCIYGPRQFGTEDQGWVAHFLIRALQGEPITLYGDGRRYATPCSSTTRWTPGSRPGADRPASAAGPSTSAAGPTTPSACASCSTRIERADRRRARGAVSATGGPATSSGTFPTPRARAATRLESRAPASREGIALPGRLAGENCVADACRRREASAHEVRAGQSELDLRRQHLFRLPRAAPAAGARLAQGAAGAGRARGAGDRRPSVRAVRERYRAPSSPASGPTSRSSTTAPTYLFWRCAPPELRVPQQLTGSALGDAAARMVAVGPHGSTTPRAALRKLGVDGVVWASARRSLRDRRAATGSDRRRSAYRPTATDPRQWRPAGGALRRPAAAVWPDEWIARHHHHHHRFDAAPAGPGAEIEASRGCPYSCTLLRQGEFPRPLPPARPAAVLRGGRPAACAGRRIRLLHRRDLPAQPAAARGAGGRGLKFGVQTRIDLWKPEMLELLGRAGCVSIEAGVESLTPEGRDALDKNCRHDDRRARRPPDPAPSAMSRSCRPTCWRCRRTTRRSSGVAQLRERWRLGQRSGAAVPLSGLARLPQPLGPAGRQAWERAHDHYLTPSPSSAICRMTAAPLGGWKRELRR